MTLEAQLRKSPWRPGGASSAADASTDIRHPPRMRRRWLAGVVLLAAALVITLGADRRAAEPAAGYGANGPGMRPPDGQTMRVATFNIHGGRGTDGRLDLDRTADCLRGFDLVALQEVHGAASVMGADQAELLGRRLQMPWLFAPTETRFWHDHFGNGLLSRLPVDAWRRVPLESSGGKGFRNTLSAAAELNGRTVRVLVAHVSLGVDRAGQLRTVVDRFLALEAPALLLGDLNTGADDPILRELLARDDVRDPLSEVLPERDPEQRGDWILTRGFDVLDAGIAPGDASDHAVVFAELGLDP